MRTPKRYFTEIVQESNGSFRFAFAKRLVDVNQYKRKWKNVNARSVARELNRGKIVIK